MSFQITVHTTDGRSTTAISYSVPAGAPMTPQAMGAQMSGGMAYGNWHVRSANGWLRIPANQIAWIDPLPGTGRPT